MKKHYVIKSGVALALCASLGTGLSVAHAQRGRTPGQNRDQRMQQWQNMTPAERQQAMQKMQQQMEQRREQQVTESLTDQGINDPKAQNAILEFIKAQTKARQPLRELSRKLAETLADKNAMDGDISTQLQALNDAVKAEKERSIAAEKDLDDKIGYTKTPRLEALLTTMGLIGENSAYTGGGGFGGRGGRGGGQGGFGGRGGGGQGGGPNGGGGQGA